MGVIVENMREIHQLGAATREWLVSGKRVPGFGATHTRIAGYTEARADYAFVRHDPAFRAYPENKVNEEAAAVSA